MLAGRRRGESGDVAPPLARGADGLEEVTVTAVRLPEVWRQVTDAAVAGVDAVVRTVSPRGIRNHNPGNIRFLALNPWRGQVGNDRGYGIYASPDLGVRALGKQLQAYARRGLVTVRDIITTWAPPVGRDPVTGKAYTQATSAYVAQVARALGVKADDRIDVTASLPALATAIIRHENGVQPYAPADIAKWVYLA